MNQTYYKNLKILRKKIEKYKNSSNDNINKLIRKRKNLQKKETMISKRYSIESLKDWKRSA